MTGNLTGRDSKAWPSPNVWACGLIESSTFSPPLKILLPTSLARQGSHWRPRLGSNQCLRTQAPLLPWPSQATRAPGRLPALLLATTFSLLQSEGCRLAEAVALDDDVARLSAGGPPARSLQTLQGKGYSDSG